MTTASIADLELSKLRPDIYSIESVSPYAPVTRPTLLAIFAI